MPQVGDIGFVAGRSFLDRVIEFFDNGNYNHCFIVMPKNSILESQYLTNTRIVASRFKNSEVTYLSLNLTDEQKDKLIHTSFTYLEDKYDIKQLFGILFHDLFYLNTNVTWNDKKKLICSELVVDVLHDIGYLTETEYGKLYGTTPNLLFTYLHNRLLQVS